MKNNDLAKYSQWLRKKDLATNTINNYSRAARLYGEKPLTTSNLREYVRNNLTKYEPSSLYTGIKALTIYGRYQKVKQKYFPILTELELEQLKRARFEENN
ncbi:15534_t:CDS:2 [Entrophospora sp. SA101]|nr:12402_t:CDS:2 [Entrophospora sp. SA101]CAJ0761332.1 15534_t:CDS:2 [Entrophospora sp. SA101]CAJ0851500.1 780_t:CDS:2 [Entrophospora sp. SA101]CAJ0855692.1 17279_t:CDS:2 [Entrophospora sp. SA101]